MPMYKPTSNFIHAWLKKYGARPNDSQIQRYLDEAIVIVKGRYWDGIKINQILFIPSINLIFICDWQSRKILKFTEAPLLKKYLKELKDEG